MGRGAGGAPGGHGARAGIGLRSRQRAGRGGGRVTGAGLVPRKTARCTTGAGLVPRKAAGCTTRGRRRREKRGTVPQEQDSCREIRSAVPLSRIRAEKNARLYQARFSAASSRLAMWYRCPLFSAYLVQPADSLGTPSRVLVQRTAFLGMGVSCLVQRTNFLDTISKRWYSPALFSAPPPSRGASGRHSWHETHPGGSASRPSRRAAAGAGPSQVEHEVRKCSLAPAASCERHPEMGTQSVGSAYAPLTRWA